MDKNVDRKTCPIKFISCIESKCGWWYSDEGCALSVIPEKLVLLTEAIDDLSPGKTIADEIYHLDDTIAAERSEICAAIRNLETVFLETIVQK